MFIIYYILWKVKTRFGIFSFLFILNKIAQHQVFKIFWRDFDFCFQFINSTHLFSLYQQKTFQKKKKLLKNDKKFPDIEEFYLMINNISVREKITENNNIKIGLI